MSAAISAPWLPPPTLDGVAMHDLVTELFPICRSITGHGVRETLKAIAGRLPLILHEVPSGTRAFDWVVPNEWNIQDAYIANTSGRRQIDFHDNNLHVVGYSQPVRARMPLAALQPHLHSLPEQSDAIPYRTSYYDETWGFCLTDRQRTALIDDEYDVVIDSTLTNGSLTYGECVLPGNCQEQVLIYTHTCHPSLANDNLTGIAVCTFLARWLASVEHRFTYRFVFGPGTIGSLVWLSRNQHSLAQLRHGLVGVSLGDAGPLRYKQSRRGDAPVDRAAAHVLKHSGRVHQIEPFSPVGYDERQFCSPGFDLPVGRLSRSASEAYPEYHTSLDTPALIQPDALAESLAIAAEILATLESDGRYVNTQPFGEPQLGRRGLYRRHGGPDLPDRERAMLWVLNLSDSKHSLLEIADRASLPMRSIVNAAAELREAALLVPAP